MQLSLRSRRHHRGENKQKAPPVKFSEKKRGSGKQFINIKQQSLRMDVSCVRVLDKAEGDCMQRGY